ncbi:hypothetical protein KP509_03G071700 [Ceratopteris richardii]|nr:hypothetical protein KP509_03G071700 [Ceratopteris richardii]
MASDGGDSKVDVKVHHDRSLLRANNPPSPTDEHPEYQTHKRELPTSRPPCVSKVFSFTPSSIDDLRRQASSDVGRDHSRYEVLAAHLWRSIIRARELDPQQEIRFGMPVDGRKRLDPPLPEGYFGNAVFYAYTSCKAGELVGNSLSFAADLVKTAIAKVDNAHMRSAVDWIASQESIKSIVPAYTPFIDLAMTSWWRFPLCDQLDFVWGNPSHIRTTLFAFQGLVILFPSYAGSGHVDALVGLQATQMPKFEEYVRNS